MGIAGPVVWQPGYEAYEVYALGRGPHLGAVHLHICHPPDLVLGCRIEAGTGWGTLEAGHTPPGCVLCCLLCVLRSDGIVP